MTLRATGTRCSGARGRTRGGTRVRATSPGKRCPVSSAISTTRSGAAGRSLRSERPGGSSSGSCASFRGFARPDGRCRGAPVAPAGGRGTGPSPAVHPGHRRHVIIGLVTARLEGHGVPRGTVLNADRGITAAPPMRRCRRAGSVRPVPGRSRPTKGTQETPRRRRRARQRQPPPIVRTALARALPDGVPVLVRFRVRLRASTSTGTDPEDGQWSHGLHRPPAAGALRQEGLDAVLRACGAADRKGVRFAGAGPPERR